MALGIIIGVCLLFCVIACACFSRPIVAAVAVDCEREPDRRNKKAYARWLRECEERKRIQGNGRLSMAFPSLTKSSYQAVET